MGINSWKDEVKCSTVSSNGRPEDALMALRDNSLIVIMVCLMRMLDWTIRHPMRECDIPSLARFAMGRRLVIPHLKRKLVAFDMTLWILFACLYEDIRRLGAAYATNLLKNAHRKKWNCTIEEELTHLLFQPDLLGAHSAWTSERVLAIPGSHTSNNENSLWLRTFWGKIHIPPVSWIWIKWSCWDLRTNRRYGVTYSRRWPPSPQRLLNPVLARLLMRMIWF